MEKARLENVSDTALWVAIYRAMETERPDAIFRDPFARKLAGERGQQIVDTMKVAGIASPMIVRTAVMDEIILRLVAEEDVDTVVNLAAGLDARPYRLPLPSGLRWVEVDLPPMIAFKTERLASEDPVCRLERIPANLADPAARREALRAAASGSRKALVVTEGLLVYLEEEAVKSFAKDLAAVPAFRFWLVDIVSPRLLKMLQKKYGKALDAANAPFRFAPAEGSAFYLPLGWKEREFRSYMEDARRLKREMKMAWLWRLMARLSSKAKQEEFRRMSGTLLLERTN